MKRLSMVPLLFVLACVLCGAYGALHNQLSYSVSPEYFTKLKFAQFGIDASLHSRLGVAVVGWQASWWMGIAIGMFLIPFGLLVRDTRRFVITTLRAFVVVLLTTVLFGLVGLGASFMLISTNGAEELWVRGQRIGDPAAFLRAGAMHNCSYAGATIGVFAGMLSILRRFLLLETGSAALIGAGRSGRLPAGDVQR